MSTEKWLPEVGQEFEWSNGGLSNWKGKQTCIVVTEKTIGCEDANGHLFGISKAHNFRPIPTKADVEREVLMTLLNKHFFGKDIHKTIVVNEIRKAGFTIPKKVKRIDIKACLCHYNNSLYKICELLGDLVEGNDD